jgi:hypothetical protein
MKDYNELREIINKYNFKNYNYVKNFDINKITALSLILLMEKNNYPIPEFCVAEDAEIEFDWIINDKEAILSISIENRYTILLKQKSGKFISESYHLSEEISQKLTNYIMLM